MGESLVRSLIRLLVTVGVLAAVYFFIVNPVLDTTNDTIDRAFNASSDFQQSIDESLQQAGIDNVTADEGLTGIGDVDLSAAIAAAPDKRTKKLLRCIDRANGDVEKISRCQRRFTP